MEASIDLIEKVLKTNPVPRQWTRIDANLLAALAIPISSSTGARVQSLYTVSISNNTWTPIEIANCSSTPTREEQLLRERTRATEQCGVSSFATSPSNDAILIPYGNCLMLCQRPFTCAQLLLTEQSQSPLHCAWAPDSIVFSYVAGLQIRVASRYVAEPITLTSIVNTVAVKAGTPAYVIQEEFERFHGVWWAPTIRTAKGVVVMRMLYEVVDESHVDHLALRNENGGVDFERYPRAGRSNAVSELRIAELQFPENDSTRNCWKANIIHRRLKLPLPNWTEYIVRAGWGSTMDKIYAQIIDRKQQRMETVLFDIDTDMEVIDENQIFDMQPNEGIESSFGQCLVSESCKEAWINVTNIIAFFDNGSLLYSSEETGYRHLYMIANCKRPYEIRTLTSGEWVVDGRSIWIDECRRIVYFIANKDDVLELHLYCVHLDSPDRITRLSPLGCTVESASLLNPIGATKSPFDLVVLTTSSLTIPTSSHVYELTANGLSLSAKRQLTLLQVQDHIDASTIIVPQLFTIRSPSSPSPSETLHCALFTPRTNCQRPYRTVVYVYGGPHVQLVRNEWSVTCSTRPRLLALCGFAVAIVDGRGSWRRGKAFEGVLRDRMGQVEMIDQVALVDHLIESGISDCDHIAITGWSYGGYLSLMALCQRPDVFKIAIAGAPVTQWELYDTAYVERYIGLPSDDQDAYRLGSVVQRATSFPSETNRLVIAHGLIDENVHFEHTSNLIDALIHANKPYVLKLFPKERHGLRSRAASAYFLKYLVDHLERHL